MRLVEFDFPFDPSLIAQYPIHPRDAARLFVVPRGAGPCAHKKMTDLPDLLTPGDLLVLNDTKVMPARLWGKKIPSGGKVELLVIRPFGVDFWEALVKGTVAKDQRIAISDDIVVRIVEKNGERALIHMESEIPMQDVLNAVGKIPLPPYIKREPTKEDREDYQTVFARNVGAVAAPTAGLHFSPELLDALARRKIHHTFVTLHVGPGTFRPVTVDNIHEHPMDPEWFDVPAETELAVRTAKAQGRRVVAVGTTVMRSLESCVADDGQLRSYKGETRLFITPGFRFQVVDALLTNFHFPRTTLLMLVSAFAGIDQARRAYEIAVEQRYRMYSYGDAMLILSDGT